MLSIAAPSYSLCYCLVYIQDPTLTVRVIGNQWYWSYEYSFNTQTELKIDPTLTKNDLNLKDQIPFKSTKNGFLGLPDKKWTLKDNNIGVLKTLPLEVKIEAVHIVLKLLNESKTSPTLKDLIIKIETEVFFQRLNFALKDKNHIGLKRSLLKSTPEEIFNEINNLFTLNTQSEAFGDIVDLLFLPKSHYKISFFLLETLLDCSFCKPLYEKHTLLAKCNSFYGNENTNIKAKVALTRNEHIKALNAFNKSSSIYSLGTNSLLSKQSLDFGQVNNCYIEAFLLPDSVNDASRFSLTDNLLILPTQTRIRFIILSNDVLHSFAAA